MCANRCLATAAAALLLIPLIPSLALAQTAPPPGAVDDRFRTQTSVVSPEKTAEEALLSGDGDLLLLRRTQHFSLHGSFSDSYTSNAFLSPMDPKSDKFTLSEFGLGASTRIAQKVTLFADVSALEARYSSYKSLDYSALTGVLGAAASLGRVDLELSYRPARIYEIDFRHRQLTQNRLGLTASIPFKIGRLTLVPSVSVERVRSDPADYRNRAASGQLSATYPLSTKAPLLLFASGGYEYRSYNSYFPDLLGTKRDDRRLQVNAGVQWRPTTWANVSLSYAYQRNNSTSDVNSYRARSGLLGLSLQTQF